MKATELKLYIDNDSGLYHQQTTSILKNLATKRAKGVYKHDLAVKLFGYLVESGAKKYAKEFGSSDQPWHKMFDVATRKQVAEALTHDFEVEAKLGNYDHLAPKKYQGTTRHHATRHHATRRPSDIEADIQRLKRQMGFDPTPAEIKRMSELKAEASGASKKSPAQLQREIDQALSNHRQSREKWLSLQVGPRHRERKAAYDEMTARSREVDAALARGRRR